MKSTGIPCIILRAGMIAGQGGSSFEILRNLARNLPAMILPRWTQTKTQVIYIDDIVRVICTAAMNPQFFNQTIDVVNGEALNYEELIRQTCTSLHKDPYFIRVPIHSTAFSKLWVSIFGNTDYELASPLIDSLLCELPQNPPSQLIDGLIQNRNFSSMLELIEAKPKIPVKRKKLQPVVENSVRSIQRLPSLPHLGCADIAKKYETWLPAAVGFVRVESSEVNGHHLEFRMRGLPWPLLVLKTIPEAEIHQRRIKFHIVGGLLSKRSDCGWLEFRQIAGRQFTLASINEFVPMLPWYIYRFTQAIVHKRVMRAFARSL